MHCWAARGGAGGCSGSGARQARKSTSPGLPAVLGGAPCCLHGEAAYSRCIAQAADWSPTCPLQARRELVNLLWELVLANVEALDAAKGAQDGTDELRWAEVWRGPGAGAGLEPSAASGCTVACSALQFLPRRQESAAFDSPGFLRGPCKPAQPPARPRAHPRHPARPLAPLQRYAAHVPPYSRCG